MSKGVLLMTRNSGFAVLLLVLRPSTFTMSERSPNSAAGGTSIGAHAIAANGRYSAFVAAAQRKDSITRSIAGCFRFLILIQCFVRPARYGRSRCFETNPSNPNNEDAIRPAGQQAS